MAIEIRETQEWTVLTPTERSFDVHLVPAFKQEVTRLIERGRFKIILELKNVLHVDTAGLGAMVFTLRLVEGKGTVVLCGIHEAFLALLKTTGLDRVFRTVDSADDLISSACGASVSSADRDRD